MEETRKNKIWYFENFNILNSLNQKEKESLSSCSVMKVLNRNQPLYIPYDQASRIYFLKRGKVKISSYSKDGKEMIHTILGPGEIFGEMALTGEKERQDYALVMESAIVCSVKVEDFEKILQNNPAFSRQVTKLIGFRLKRIRTRLERMWFKTASERVCALLNDLAEDYGIPSHESITITMRITHQEMANLAATTRQTVTTTLNTLERQGIITYNRRKITILKPKALVEE